MSVLGDVSLGDQVSFVVVDHNPALTATDCAAGSLISWIHDDIPTPVLFYKRTTGSDTNVVTLTIRHNMTATTDPSITDDPRQGFSIGSSWYNTITGKLFQLTNEAPFASNWVQLN